MLPCWRSYCPFDTPRNVSDGQDEHRKHVGISPTLLVTPDVCRDRARLSLSIEPTPGVLHVIRVQGAGQAWRRTFLERVPETWEVKQQSRLMRLAPCAFPT